MHERGLYDFLDALVALGFLERNGNKETATYANAADTDLFLDKNKLSYIGGILEMANNRLHPFWNFLEEGLKKVTPQNEIRLGEASLFEKIYSDKDKTREFINAMGGAQAGNLMAFADQFDFSPYNTLCDVGGAGAQLSAHVVSHNPHMKCVSFDLPPVAPIALENVSRMGVSDKEMLIRKAYEALPKGGALVVIENIIDNERRENAFGLLMSLNMLIETAEGFDFTFDDFVSWSLAAGFRESTVMNLSGSTSAVIAIK